MAIDAPPRRTVQAVRDHLNPDGVASPRVRVQQVPAHVRVRQLQLRARIRVLRGVVDVAETRRRGGDAGVARSSRPSPRILDIGGSVHDGVGDLSRWSCGASTGGDRSYIVTHHGTYRSG